MRRRLDLSAVRKRQVDPRFKRLSIVALQLYQTCGVGRQATVFVYGFEVMLRYRRGARVRGFERHGHDYT